MRIIRFIGYCLAVLVLVLIAGTLVPRPLFGEEPSENPAHQILVLSNPIHTDIALPLTDDLRARFAFLAESGLPLDAPGARYLVFGWGGRSFYIETPTWSELKPGPLFKGLTSDASAMHVALVGELDLADPAIAAYTITDANRENLLAHIRSSFAEQSGKPVEIAGAGYGEFDRFYEAKGTFTALLGCNTWTAAGLRAAGLRTGWWNPLPVLLAWSMRLYNEPSAQ